MADSDHLRIIFMGTPDFGATVLHALIASTHQVVGVVTQPDRPAGRKNSLTPPPVKIVAQEVGLPVVQVERLRDPATHATLADFGADVFVVASFGIILPGAVLAIPPLGCLNVHASLLPAYRGASPITQAILDGHSETGITIMQMDKGLDTGVMLTKAAEPIRADDTTATLSARLADVGARLLLKTLPQWARGSLTPEAQDPTQATLTGLIKKEDGRIIWTQAAVHIERMTRAYDPWPGAFSVWNGQQLRVVRGHVVADDLLPGVVVARAVEGRRGLWPVVGTGNGALVLDRVQLAGKKEMSGGEFVRGYPAFATSTL